MAIGPNGPPPGMGAGPPPGQAGIDQVNASMGQQMPFGRGGGDVMAAKQRLMEIASEAETILSKHPELAQELMGEEAVPATPVGVPGGMPEMPVAANTGPPMGGMPQGLIA